MAWGMVHQKTLESTRDQQTSEPRYIRHMNVQYINVYLFAPGDFPRILGNHVRQQLVAIQMLNQKLVNHSDAASSEAEILIKCHPDKLII